MSVDVADSNGTMVATIDDGKANALTIEVIDGLRKAVATASRRDRPLVISGRSGCFSAGFDLAVVNSGDRDLVSTLFADGALLFRELVEAPVPIVASCTGHALAGGALLLLTRTTGSAGPGRIRWASTR